MRTALLTTLSILTLGLAAPAFAAADSAAVSTDNKPIYDSAGHCVRTKWQGASDACSPTAAKPTATKAAPFHKPAAHHAAPAKPAAKAAAKPAAKHSKKKAKKKHVAPKPAPAATEESGQ